ncbi:MAG: PQQ-binding-like beta-propeller repeat protein, partial [Alphaproteobacteria bacterium]
MKFLKPFVGVSVLVAGLAACSDSVDPKDKLRGERISVLAFESKIEADPRLGQVPVRLPRPYVNENWSQPGGYASHAMHHLMLDGPLKERWAAGIGIGAWDYGKLLVPPIVVGDVVFAADAEGHVSAFDLKSGKRFWTRNVSIRGEDPDENVGGGLAYGDGRLYISTGLGFVIAVEARTGNALWHRKIGLPFRAAPTFHDGRVYVISHDNQLFALDAKNGETLWEHAALVEAAGLLGNSSVAVEDDIVIAPFTSGEVVALRAENGKVLWQDSLTRTGRLTSLSTLADIAGRPVIDRGLVFAASHA